jgi:hypothetical protein
VKKLILILLLFIAPLQFAWAAAGAYCQHEQGKSSMHFGHHAHSHEATHDASDSKTKASKVHLDCSSCHTTASAILVSSATFTLIPSALEYFEPRAISYSSFIPDGPRRPDRLTGA